MEGRMRAWKLQDAKARLSEVVKEAEKHGPQTITLRGQPTVVMLSKDDYDKLTMPKRSFIDFMRHSPLAKIRLTIDRDPSLTRDFDL
jgi:antitoxin Phd